MAFPTTHWTCPLDKEAGRTVPATATQQTTGGTVMKQVLEMALEALELEDLACRYEKEPTPEHIAKAITAIKEALAQPEQEPVARLEWIVNHGWHTTLLFPAGSIPAGSHNLYTTPPQRKPLTRAQIINALATTMNFNSRDYDEVIEPIARAIESAHGIKGDA